MDTKIYQLSELATIKYGKNQKKVENEEGHYPIYGTGGLMGHADQFLYDRPSVLIGRKGTIDKVRYVEHPFWTVDTLFYTIINEELIIPKYLFYLLSIIDLKQYNEGTTIPSLRTETLNRIELEIPSLEDQKRVLACLNPIDSKIENNNAINRNLSEQLESVYIERFASELNGTLADICEYTKAKIDVQNLTEETYYSTENMLPNKMGATTATGLPTTGKTPMCIEGNVLVSNIRPYFKKIVYCHGTAGCSADVLCFVAKNKKSAPYLYATLFVDKFFEYMVAGSKGTKMPRGDKQQIMQYPIHIPTEEELETFGAFANNILEVIHTNNEENVRLQGLRDSMLPKLMSGELDISTLDI